MASHPSQTHIELLVRGKLDETAAAEVRAHMELCPECRRLLQACQANEALVERLLEAVSDPIGKLLEDGETSGHPEREAILPEGIEGYEFLREIHRGGQGIVYEAREQFSRRRVALKVLLHGRRASLRERHRFEREVRIAASLKHPALATVHGGGIAEGCYYYAMEYIEGEPLDAYINRRRPSIRELMRLFKGIAEALAYAHQHGVIHRDLKPGNILIEDHGGQARPRVLDFGLAKRILPPEGTTPQMSVSVTGHPTGTPFYMSPEQVAGRGDLDTRTDIYSLGVLMFRALTGQLPYPGLGDDQSITRVFHSIESEPARRASSVVPGFDRGIEAILDKCLEKAPERRYPTVEQLKEDIHHWLADEPLSVRPLAWPDTLRRFVAHHRIAAATVALVAVILLSSSAASTYFFLREQHARQQAEGSLAMAEARLADHQHLRRVAQTVLFAMVLNDWQHGQPKLAAAKGALLEKGSPEETAAAFLLDPRPLAEKESDFQAALGQSDPELAALCLAEHLTANGDAEAAMDVLEKIPDRASCAPADERGRWYRSQAAQRLEELRNGH